MPERKLGVTACNRKRRVRNQQGSSPPFWCCLRYQLYFYPTILGAIDSTAAHREGYSPRCSCTRRTARSRTSDENCLDLFMAPFSQRVEPPPNPGRFNPTETLSPPDLLAGFCLGRSCYSTGLRGNPPPKGRIVDSLPSKASRFPHCNCFIICYSCCICCVEVSKEVSIDPQHPDWDGLTTGGNQSREA